MSPPLAAREAPLAWSAREGQGEVAPGGWLEPALATRAPGLGYAVPSSDQPRFLPPALAAWLPPGVARAATAAQALGAATAWEGLAHLLARPAWWVAAREHLFAPYGASPAVQAALLARFGVEARLHRHDPARLARLTALLPRWRQARGQLEAAAQVCEAADQDLGAALSQAAEGAAVAEIFVCRRAEGWTGGPIAGGVLQIQGGLLQITGRRAAHPEELTLAWSPGGALPSPALRLLPTWTAVRLSPPPPEGAPPKRKP